MSAPTDDEIRLKREKEEELERIRQAGITATIKSNNAISLIKTSVTFTESYLSDLLYRIEDSIEMSLTLSDINHLRTSCKKKLNALLSIEVPSETAKKLAFAERLEEEAKRITDRFKADITPHENRINGFIAESKSTLAELSGSRTSVYAIDFDFGNTDRIETVANIVDRLNYLAVETQELLNSESLQEKDRKRLMRISSRLNAAVKHDEKTFERLLSEFCTLKAEVVKNIEIFDALYQKYIAVNEYLISTENEHRASPLPVISKEKRHFKTLESLDNELKAITKASMKTAKTNYIRKQFDEVMNLFGYDTTKSISFANSPTATHFISESTQDNTAIYVNITEENHLFMEVMNYEKVSSRGRPSKAVVLDSQSLTDEEKEYLVTQQSSFCDIHPLITEELGKRGIILKNHSRKAPRTDRCKKMRNFCDVDYATATENYNPKASESLDSVKLKSMQLSLK